MKNYIHRLILLISIYTCTNALPIPTVPHNEIRQTKRDIIWDNVVGPIIESPGFLVDNGIIPIRPNTINPNFNPNLNPNLNPNINPNRLNPNIDPIVNPNINPNLNPNLNPNINPNINPNFNANPFNPNIPLNPTFSFPNNFNTLFPNYPTQKNFPIDDQGFWTTDNKIIIGAVGFFLLLCLLIALILLFCRRRRKPERSKGVILVKDISKLPIALQEAELNGNENIIEESSVAIIPVIEPLEMERTESNVENPSTIDRLDTNTTSESMQIKVESAMESLGIQNQEPIKLSINTQNLKTDSELDENNWKGLFVDDELSARKMSESSQSQIFLTYQEEDSLRRNGSTIKISDRDSIIAMEEVGEIDGSLLSNLADYNDSSSEVQRIVVETPKPNPNVQVDRIEVVVKDKPFQSKWARKTILKNTINK